MAEEVKSTRAYRSSSRARQSQATRANILDAARVLFLRQGYPQTTVLQIARRADVHIDTVYAVVGRKPDLIRAVVESALSGEAHPIPALERDYVRDVRAAITARDKIDLYAQAVARMAPRTAPVFQALRAAAAADSSCASLYAEITERRAANMRLFAADLRTTGSIRADLSDDDVADVVWSMNSEMYYSLLVEQRGWTTERFGRHLSDAWQRLFLRASSDC